MLLITLILIAMAKYIFKKAWGNKKIGDTINQHPQVMAPLLKNKVVELITTKTATELIAEILTGMRNEKEVAKTVLENEYTPDELKKINEACRAHKIATPDTGAKADVPEKKTKGKKGKGK